MTLSKWIPHPEGYRLTVNEQGIRIEGSTPQGVFYGLQTFRQLITSFMPLKALPSSSMNERHLKAGEL